MCVTVHDYFISNYYLTIVTLIWSHQNSRWDNRRMWIGILLWRQMCLKSAGKWTLDVFGIGQLAWILQTHFITIRLGAAHFYAVLISTEPRASVCCEKCAKARILGLLATWTQSGCVYAYPKGCVGARKADRNEKMTGAHDQDMFYFQCPTGLAWLPFLILV